MHAHGLCQSDSDPKPVSDITYVDGRAPPKAQEKHRLQDRGPVLLHACLEEKPGTMVQARLGFRATFEAHGGDCLFFAVRDADEEHRGEKEIGRIVGGKLASYMTSINDRKAGVKPAKVGFES